MYIYEYSGYYVIYEYVPGCRKHRFYPHSRLETGAAWRVPHLETPALLRTRVQPVLLGFVFLCFLFCSVLYIAIWSLCCLPFDLQILINHLASSNFSNIYCNILSNVIYFSYSDHNLININPTQGYFVTLLFKCRYKIDITNKYLEEIYSILAFSTTFLFPTQPS